MSDSRVVWERGKHAIIAMIAGCMAPLLILYHASSSKDVIGKDVLRWAEVLEYRPLTAPWMLLQLLAGYPEFRTLFYYRLSQGNLLPKVLAHLVKSIYRECPTLSISAQNSIGPGLFIQHGFSTIVAAESIGANCVISQQVTIGYTTKTDCPQLGHHVVIGAGAKVLGRVRLGDHVIVGANAVVVKDVPDHCVVVGVPARIVRRDGVRVNEALT